jgi:hypothetical protein
MGFRFTLVLLAVNVHGSSYPPLLDQQLSLMHDCGSLFAETMVYLTGTLAVVSSGRGSDLGNNGPQIQQRIATTLEAERPSIPQMDFYMKAPIEVLLSGFQAVAATAASAATMSEEMHALFCELDERIHANDVGALDWIIGVRNEISDLKDRWRVLKVRGAVMVRMVKRDGTILKAFFDTSTTAKPVSTTTRPTTKPVSTTTRRTSTTRTPKRRTPKYTTTTTLVPEEDNPEATRTTTITTRKTPMSSTSTSTTSVNEDFFSGDDQEGWEVVGQYKKIKRSSATGATIGTNTQPVKTKETGSITRTIKPTEVRTTTLTSTTFEDVESTTIPEEPEVSLNTIPTTRTLTVSESDASKRGMNRRAHPFFPAANRLVRPMADPLTEQLIGDIVNSASFVERADRTADIIALTANGNIDVLGWAINIRQKIQTVRFLLVDIQQSAGELFFVTKQLPPDPVTW